MSMTYSAAVTSERLVSTGRGANAGRGAGGGVKTSGRRPVIVSFVPNVLWRRGSSRVTMVVLIQTEAYETWLASGQPSPSGAIGGPARSR